MSIYSEVYILFQLIMIQFRLLFIYWIGGILLSTLLSVFASEKISNMITKVNFKNYEFLSFILAAFLGAVSPMCMYGTVPIIATLGKKGIPQHFLAAFMISSILINPNLFIFSLVLGVEIALIRLIVSIIAGVTAGLLVKKLFADKNLFNFEGFFEKKKCTEESLSLKKFLNQLHKMIVKTAPYLFIGITLTALLERYFPKEILISLFDNNNGFSVLFATSIGVPLYLCGGGTIPIIKSWLTSGMGVGSAVAFMISGPATKLNNLSAVKIILGVKNFVLYLSFNIIFAIIIGLIINIAY